MLTRRRASAGLAVVGGLWCAVALGQDPAAPPEPAPEVLPPVTVTAPPPLASSSEQIIPGRDFELRPQGRPADVLRPIPGLIINQHQGGGKAEQYIIRGFDADHGTDRSPRPSSGTRWAGSRTLTSSSSPSRLS